ncbi:MAG TPA: hypothetical protein VF275_01780 [Gammaproteobacteria bacterium]
MDLQVILNTYATDVFRRQADLDYVAARMNYQLQLRQQFLWSGHQAIEKYLKGILLFNGLSSRWYEDSDGKKHNYVHNLPALLIHAQKLPHFENALSKRSEEFLNLLDRTGGANNRYIVTRTFNLPNAIHMLDELVWRIRRFCQYMPDRGLGSTAPVPGLRNAFIRSLHKEEYLRNPHKFRLPGGELERILKRKPSDKARRALVWANLWYGSKARKAVSYQSFSSSEIPPRERNWRDVDWDEVEKYVRL